MHGRLFIINRRDLFQATVRRYTAAEQQRRIMAERRVDERREANLRQLNVQIALDSSATIGDKADEKRTCRFVAEQQRERDKIAAIERAQREKVILEQQQEQEERLAAELERIKLDKCRDEKMRQQIRETRFEL